MKIKRLNFVVIITIVVVLLGIFYWYSVGKVNYHNKSYTIKNTEYGVMLVDKYNGSAFHIGRVFKNDTTLIMYIYDYQARSSGWVQLKKNNITDIDSSIFIFSRLQEILPSTL